MFRKLTADFGDEVAPTWVMGGLAREYAEGQRAPLAFHWLDVAEETGMPVDARLWQQAPIGSTYPACMAVKAAAEQAADGGAAYLRSLREGLFCFRRKLDTTEALVEEARRVGLDAERFRIDLRSNAIVEIFGADLERARAIPAEARERGGVVAGRDEVERLVFPSVAFRGDDGVDHWVFGHQPYERYREAAEAAGARPAEGSPPGVLEAVRRFGRMATREVAEVCDLPGPRAFAELWKLATEWRLRPVPVVTDHIWELP